MSAAPEMVFHDVLVAVDGSKDAALALAAAVLAVQRNHARLTVIAVAEDVTRRPGAIAFDPTLQQRVDESTEEHLRDARRGDPAGDPGHDALPPRPPGAGDRDGGQGGQSTTRSCSAHAASGASARSWAA